MKPLFLAICISITTLSQAQQKPTELDKSPLDMSYWPANYPILKMTGKANDLPIARVLYSRPQKNNRSIFGGIIKYNEIWRLGANEATEIEFFKPVQIDGKKVPKGRYTLYCIPSESKWIMIINKDNYCWGNFMYDVKKDLLRTTISTDKTSEAVEAMTIYFEETKTGANLIIMWDDIKGILPINL
ncbi:DUF2911 domain-containing protein [Parasediminibacterium paludis]|uniref:DUF2911 domain-containing protein n=1 Tax=Parasediminibacterium paludis TaxID=908966 RepID=A0ABV8Q2X9_9BACT